MRHSAARNPPSAHEAFRQAPNHCQGGRVVIIVLDIECQASASRKAGISVRHLDLSRGFSTVRMALVCHVCCGISVCGGFARGSRNELAAITRAIAIYRAPVSGEI